MNLKSLIFLLSIAWTTLPAAAQRGAPYGHKFSNEDMHAFLLYESKKQKTRGFVALLAGPALTALGLHIIHQNEYYDVNGARVTSGHQGAVLGYALGTAGLSTTFGSITLFASAEKLKKRARRLLTDPLASQ
jgi:hypothetical protein